MSETYYQVWRNSDMTEGRGPMRPVEDEVYELEQDAWDACNDKPGVMGRHPSRGAMRGHNGVLNWQEYKAKHGYSDWDVRPLKLKIKRGSTEGRTRAMVAQLGLRVQELTDALEAAQRLAAALDRFGSVDGAWGAYPAAAGLQRHLGDLKRATVKMRDEMDMDTTWEWEKTK